MRTGSAKPPAQSREVAPKPRTRNAPQVLRRYAPPNGQDERRQVESERDYPKQRDRCDVHGDHVRDRHEQSGSASGEGSPED